MAFCEKKTSSWRGWNGELIDFHYYLNLPQNESSRVRSVSFFCLKFSEQRCDSRSFFCKKTLKLLLISPGKVFRSLSVEGKWDKEKWEEKRWTWKGKSDEANYQLMTALLVTNHRFNVVYCSAFPHFRFAYQSINFASSAWRNFRNTSKFSAKLSKPLQQLEID